MIKTKRLSFDVEEIDKKLGFAEPNFYSTNREELADTLGIEGATYESVKSDVIWGLYDALMADYPDRVSKNPIYNDDRSFTNYEYVVSTGDYNDVKGSFNNIDTDIKKPKYLVACGIHGWEKASILSTYRLFRDIVTGHNIPARLREGCVIHFLPIGNPWSLDNNSRWNDNLYIDPDTGIQTTQGVDINRNFNWNWGKKNVSSDKVDNVGPSAESEKETQAIANWLRENVKNNKKVELFLDIHNVSVVYNEIAVVIGLTDNQEYNNRKKISLKGIDRVVQFWKDKICYADDTLFYTSASMRDGGMSIFYASEVLGIPSIDLELSTYPTGTETDRENLLPETVAVGAEVIGNVLMEFYERY